MTWIKALLLELKVPAVVLFIMGVVWVSAYARRLDQQAGTVRFWPPINLNGHSGKVEVTALPVEPNDADR